jgi:hypothetical protein
MMGRRTHDQEQFFYSFRARTRSGKCRCCGTVHCGPAKTPVIRDLTFNREPAKPAIGKVHSHITAQRPLRSDREHVADDEHPDHQHRIDRWSTEPRIIRRQLGMHPTQIENRSDLADRMIVWHRLIEGDDTLIIYIEGDNGTSAEGAERTTPSRSAVVKREPRSCSSATRRPRKTPRFSTGKPLAAVQTARSCESDSASMPPWSCRRDGCQPLSCPLACVESRLCVFRAWRPGFLTFTVSRGPSMG